MATEKYKTVEEYIDALSVEQKEVLMKVREAIQKGLDKKFQECINYGMIGYVVPKTIYPEGYHCDRSLPLPFAGLAAQKGSVNLYHMGIYADNDLLNWWTESYKNACQYKLDMGKSCIRFKKYNDIPYNLITELFRKMNHKQWITLYEKNIKK